MGHEVRVLAVGDPCQAIYGFAAAEFDGMEAFQQQFATNEFTLSTTFRCPRSHVDLANSIIGEMNVARKERGERGYEPMMFPDSASDGTIEQRGENQLAGQERFGRKVISIVQGPETLFYCRSTQQIAYLLSRTRY